MALTSMTDRTCLRRMRNKIVWMGLGSICTLSVLVLHTKTALGATKIKFTYGPFGQSLTVQELKNFAETGKASSKLKFFLKAADQDSSVVRRFLAQDVKISLRLADRLLYLLPGEYALFQAGQIFQTPGRVANIQALRSGVIQSLSDDSQISLLEFLEKYPLAEMTIDGVKLARTADQINRLVSRFAPSVESGAAIATELLESLVCDCEPAVIRPKPPVTSPNPIQEQKPDPETAPPG